MMGEIKWQAGVLSGFLWAMLLLPSVSEAMCMKDCGPGVGAIHSIGSSTNVQQNQMEQRSGSHNFGRDSTSVLGDVTIHIGHDRMVIKGMENSTNSVIDASVSSSVILGNLQK